MDSKASIIDIFDNYLEASLILDRQSSTEIVLELSSRGISFEETDSSEVSSILTNEDIILIEKTYSETYGEVYFIEGLIYDGEQSDISSNVVFIQDAVLNKIDDEFIYSENIYTFSEVEEDNSDDYCDGNCEECSCNEEDEEYYGVSNLLDDLVEDFVEQWRDVDDEIEFEELLKGYLMEAFDLGEENGAESIIKSLQNKYNL